MAKLDVVALPFLRRLNAVGGFIGRNCGALIRIYAGLLILVFVAELTALSVLRLLGLYDHPIAWLLAQVSVVIVCIWLLAWSVGRLLRRR